jgi:hypothetical protein
LTDIETSRALTNIVQALGLLSEALHLLKGKLPRTAYPRAWFKPNGEITSQGVSHAFSLFNEGFSAMDVAAEMEIWPRKAAELFRMWKGEQKKWEDFRA